MRANGSHIAARWNRTPVCTPFSKSISYVDAAGWVLLGSGMLGIFCIAFVLSPSQPRRLTKRRIVPEDGLSLDLLVCAMTDILILGAFGQRLTARCNRPPAAGRRPTGHHVLPIS